MMLTKYDIYNDIGVQGIALLLILFASGFIIAFFLKTHKVRLMVSLCAVGILVLFEIGIVIPTPEVLSGDGYAMTQELALICATCSAPVVIGIVLGCVTKSLYAFLIIVLSTN